VAQSTCNRVLCMACNGTSRGQLIMLCIAQCVVRRSGFVSVEDHSDDGGVTLVPDLLEEF
jgi:hypothetical protein